jgi:CHAT domain-containing protein
LYVAVVLQRFLESPVYTGKAFDLILKRKGIGFEASVIQRAALARRNASVAPKLRELRAVRNKIGQLSILGRVDGDEESQSRLVAELVANTKRLEEELTQQVPDLSIKEATAAFSRQSIADAMPSGSALVEFVALDAKQYRKRLNTPASRQYIAFVFHADQPDDVTMVDLGSTAKIDRMIAAFRKAVMAFDRPSAAKTTGARLRRAVFDPLQKSLKETRSLILAGDGNLTLLPFEILPAADGGWLIDRYDISYVGSGRDVLRFRDTADTKPTGSPLVVADPDFDLDETADPVTDLGARVSRSLDFNSSNVKQFVRLEGAEEEGRQVGARLRVRPVTRREALEAKVKAVEGPSILHVASHAFFLPQRKSPVSFAVLGSTDHHESVGLPEGLARLQRLENPMLRSGIALAGANLTLAGKRIAEQNAEDGILTAADVASELELSATDLVVLSACETGLGEVEVGEGVFGLSRSFGLAGAQTLVMSLWLVDDTVTKELMDLFYANLTAGLNCSEALKTARVAMKGKYSAPYFWGAFICHGNPNSIPIRRNATPAGASA